MSIYWKNCTYCLLMIISTHRLLVTVPKSLPKELCPLCMGFQGTWIEAKQSCKMFSLEGHILARNMFQAELTRNLAHLHFGWRWCCPSSSRWQVNRKFQHCIIRMFQIAPGAAWSQPLSGNPEMWGTMKSLSLALQTVCLNRLWWNLPRETTGAWSLWSFRAA